MIARRRRSQVTISLFPFLTILACVIGTLTLTIAGLAIGDEAEELPPAPPPASDEERIRDPQELDREIARILALLKRASELEKELKALQETIEKIQGDTSRLKDELKRAGVLQELAKLAAERKRLEKELALIREEIRRIPHEIAQRKAAESLRVAMAAAETKIESLKEKIVDALKASQAKAAAADGTAR